MDKGVVLTFIALLYCTTPVSTRDGFIKDQTMDIPFPQMNIKRDGDVPDGHLRPLGWQRRTEGPVEELPEMLGTIEFYQQYTSQNKPVVFRKGISDAPAFVSWEDDVYLKDKFAHHNMTVRVKQKGRHKDSIHASSVSMVFGSFIRNYMYEDIYLASHMPQEMLDDLPLPACLRCGTISDRLISNELWMSSGGTSSLLHSHDDHLLHCVLFGRRDFIVIDPKFKKDFNFHYDYPGSRGGHSDMNPDIVNVYKFTTVNQVPWTWSTLNNGDCIFIPSGYLHQVRSWGRSVSTTVEFAPVRKFDDTDCTLNDEEFRPLSDAHYLWSWEEGRLRLSDHNLDAESMKHILLTIAGRERQLTSNRFAHFYRAAVGNFKNAPPALRVFHYITKYRDELEISVADILQLPEPPLKKMASVFNEAYQAFLEEEDEDEDDDDYEKDEL